MSSETGASDELTPAQAAEAEAEAAEARARDAEQRADELRRKLETIHAQADSAPAAQEITAGIPNRRRPRRLTLLRSAAAVVIAGLLAAGGYLAWQQRSAAGESRLRAEFSAAARQSVVNLMSMDPEHADQSVQRVIDDSTGKFKANYQDSADELIGDMRAAKTVTKITVNDTAVESMSKDSGVVLVAATSERVAARAPKDAAPEPPRVWRVVVTLQRDGGRLKIADVEFP